MKPFHRLLLRFVHFEFAHWHLVLVALTARKHLIADVHIAATACESLLKEKLVVAHLELAGCKAQLVVLKVGLLAHIRLAFALAVAALGATLLITMRASQQDTRPIEGWLWSINLFFLGRLLLLLLLLVVLWLVFFRFWAIIFCIWAIIGLLLLLLRLLLFCVDFRLRLASFGFLNFRLPNFDFL